MCRRALHFWWKNSLGWPGCDRATIARGGVEKGSDHMSADYGSLILRLALGLLLAGHGAQKLFGWFGGPGLSGVAGWLGSIGFRPALLWASVAGLVEFGGGLLFILGLF